MVKTAPRTAIGVLGILSGLSWTLLLNAGCVGPRGGGGGTVQAGDFRVVGSGVGASPAGVPTRPSTVTGSRPGSTPTTTTPSAAREGIEDARRVVPPSPRAAAEGARDADRDLSSPGERESSPAGSARPPSLVEAKVGDLNGEPVFANAVFAEVGDRLRAEAQRMGRNEWRQLARGAIGDYLRARLELSVLEAEAREALPPEARRTGLFAAVQAMQAETLAQNFGSRSIANRRLQEQGGFRDVDEYLDARLRAELIQLQMRRVLDRRVAVSFQEIERAYEQAFDTFNPKPVAVFHQIEVLTSDESATERIRTRLDAGETFIDVAKDPANLRSPETAGVHRHEFARDAEWASVEFFRVPALNSAARALQPGEWVGPIVLGPAHRWLYLDRVERTSKSLYEVQELLSRTIRDQKERFEFNRYTRRLIGEAAHSDLDEMTERLLDIAEARFAPAQGW